MARHVNAKGLSFTAIDLGAVTSVGFLTDKQDKSPRERTLKDSQGALGELEVLRLADYAIRNPRRRPRTSQIAARISSFRMLVHDSRLSMLQGGSGARSGLRSVSLHEEISRVGFLDEAGSVVQGALIAKISDVFVLLGAEVDPCRPVSHYGIDSLMAVELRTWLVSNACVKTNIFSGSSSLSELASNIVQQARPNFRPNRDNVNGTCCHATRKVPPIEGRN